MQKETGDGNVNIHAVLDVVMHVTGMESVIVNPSGRDRDVINVNQDIGEVSVKRHVVLDVIIMNVRRMANALVRFITGQRKDGQKRNGQERNVINVNQVTGELNVDRNVAMDVILRNVRRKMEDVHVSLGGQERDVKKVGT